jgi:CDP-2,3-bis-(O-geranylgeranyl)-sn-glycerol synthase
MTNSIGILLVSVGYYLLPAYIANMAPVLFKGTLKWMATPIDQHKLYKGKPILGSHKTWRGLFVGSIAGTVVFFVQKTLAGISFFDSISLFQYHEVSAWFGFFMGLGALVGDSIKSFFKRRINVKPGKPWIPFDQTDFVIGGILFTLHFFVPSLKVVVIALLLSMGLHMLTNHIGYYLGIREVKW